MYTIVYICIYIYIYVYTSYYIKNVYVYVQLEALSGHFVTPDWTHRAGCVSLSFHDFRICILINVKGHTSLNIYKYFTYLWLKDA